jgi:hypothetical protein
MNYTCIYEDPQGNIVVAPDCSFLSAVFDQPALAWDRSPNAEAAVKHVVMDPNEVMPALYRCEAGSIRYAFTDQSLFLLIKQPVNGRFFMMIDGDCAVDPTNTRETMISHCGGNPFLIDPTYTVDRETARRIALAFAAEPIKPSFCAWLPYIDMDVDRDKNL